MGWNFCYEIANFGVHLDRLPTVCLHYTDRSAHLYPAQPTSVRADASYGDELCGHKPRDSDTHCKYSEVMWPCNAKWQPQ